MEIIRNRYLKKIRNYYDSNLIKVLTGVRRCGKSVLLKQISTELQKNLKIKKDHIIEINLENIDFIKLNTFTKLNTYIVKKIKDDEKYYIFIDEIQHIKQFEKLLASLKATLNVSIFVTGSNSKLLSGRLASLLVGRCIEFKIMPFSYTEYLEYLTINNKPEIKEKFLDYLKYGGFPQRLELNDDESIKNYLTTLYKGIIDKDICNEKSNIDKENFELISKYIMSNAGKQFSSDKIAKYFSNANLTKLYRESIYRYLRKMENACLISRVKRFDVSSKRTLKSIEKQFVVDTGFMFSSISSNKFDASTALENLVYNELIYQGYEVYIGKTYKGEIDFVAIKDGKKCFIQVAYYLLDENIIQREFTAFDSVKDPSPKYVISLDEFDMSFNGITHVNAIKFLKEEILLNIS